MVGKVLACLCCCSFSLGIKKHFCVISEMNQSESDIWVETESIVMVDAACVRHVLAYVVKPGGFELVMPVMHRTN
jgi:hypothetical protein